MKAYIKKRLKTIPVPFNKKGLKGDKAHHLKNLIGMYNNTFSYIKTLPSFHVGYYYATDKLVDLASNHGFEEKSNLLDLCCGLGGSMFCLSKKFNLNCLGVDLNSKQTKECDNRIKEAGLSEDIFVRCCNILDLTPDKIGKFDIVFSEDAFAHVPDINKLFRVCSNLLNENGLLVFSNLIKTRLLSVVAKNKFCQAWQLWDLLEFTDYTKLLTSSGFEILEIKYNIGAELIKKHIEIDVGELGDSGPEVYMGFFKDREEELVNKWGRFAYQARLERMKMYKYLENGTIDYIFVVAKKK